MMRLREGEGGGRGGGEESGLVAVQLYYTNIGSVLNCKCYQMIYSYCGYTIIVAVEEL